MRIPGGRYRVFPHPARSTRTYPVMQPRARVLVSTKYADSLRGRLLERR